MSDTDEVGRRRVQGRSPSFPFIPLEKALQRLREFDERSKGHALRVGSAIAAWRYAPGSSGGLQTIAALKAFGLMSDSGSRDERKVEVTEFAKRLLRKPPADIEQQMLKEAALRPPLLAEFWEIWGAPRPPDDDCRWQLVEQRGFTEDAARKFLAVYDDTIAFAGLPNTDKVSLDHDDMASDARDDRGQSKDEPPAPNPPSPQNAREVQLMEGERVVFSHEVEPRHHLRLVVQGEVDSELLDALEVYLELQKKRLERRVKERPPSSSSPDLAELAHAD